MKRRYLTRLGLTVLMPAITLLLSAGCSNDPIVGKWQERDEADPMVVKVGRSRGKYVGKAVAVPSMFKDQVQKGARVWWDIEPGEAAKVFGGAAAESMAVRGTRVYLGMRLAVPYVGSEMPATEAAQGRKILMLLSSETLAYVQGMGPSSGRWKNQQYWRKVR